MYLPLDMEVNKVLFIDYVGFIKCIERGVGGGGVDNPPFWG